MPTYDYECEACGHRFELFQSMTAKVKRKCPECGAPKLQRLIGPGAGFLFKGDGFYVTDYRSESYRAAEKSAVDGTEKVAEKTTDGGKPEGVAPAPKKAAPTGKASKSKTAKGKGAGKNT